MKKRNLLLIIFFALAGCTKTITVDIPDPAEEVVVEGKIENGTPPFILLTKNSPFFGGIDLNDIESYFVHDAVITVSTDDAQVQLSEICIHDLPSETQHELARSLGYNFNDTVEVPNLCVYTIPDIIQFILSGDSSVFLGKERKVYDLKIEVGGKTLTARTTIPPAIPLTALSIRPHPDPNVDSLVSVYATFTEPDTLGNFYRYFTKRNDEPFYAPVSGSVGDDKLFNGQTYTWPLERGQDPQEDIDFDVFSYFWKGDTVVVKWTTIDKAHYDFWRTLEDDSGDSPFSSPSIIKSNINGGLGVWGGYGVSYHTIIVPE